MFHFRTCLILAYSFQKVPKGAILLPTPDIGTQEANVALGLRDKPFWGLVVISITGGHATRSLLDDGLHEAFESMVLKH